MPLKHNLTTMPKRTRNDICKHCSEPIQVGEEHYALAYVYPGAHQVSAQKERDKYHVRCWLKLAGPEFSVVDQCPNCLQIRKHKQHKLCWVCYSKGEPKT
jgi:hypothetical protein